MPVIYCIDAGSTMERPEGYDTAVEIVCKSIESLDNGSQFNVLVFREMTCEQLSGDYLTVGDTSVEVTREFLKKFKARGSTIDTLQKGMAKAIEMTPAMCVLLAAYEVDGRQIIRKAKAKSVPIVTISLHRWEDADASLTKIAEETGGQFKAFREDD